MKRAAGFTLIEIIVAVAVIATALGAVLSGMARHAANASHLRNKTLTLWVAHNRLTEIQLERAWPDTGRSDGTETMAGVDWQWRAEVTETPDPNVRRINVEVGLDGQEGTLAELSGFLTQ